MFKKNLIFFVFAILFLSQILFAQGNLSGTVTDVIDGKTLQVENQQGKTFYLKLRYLEVPEPEQPLSDVVKQHLKNLTLGKTIYIQKVRILPEYTIGVALLEKVDLSQQMIRDGAGWFDIFESDSAGDSTNVYKATEAIAKSEKRGIWSINGLKPAWEFRAEKNAERLRNIEKAKPITERRIEDVSLADSVKIASQTNHKSNATNQNKMMIYDFPLQISEDQKNTIGNSLSTSNEGFSLNKQSGNIDTNNLVSFYNPNINFGYRATKFLKFNLQDSSNSKEAGIVFGYDYKLENSAQRFTAIGMILLIATKNGSPVGRRNLYLFADGKSVPTGKGIYNYFPGKRENVEFFGFKDMPKESMYTLAASKTVTISVGKFKKTLNSQEKEILDNLVQTMQ